MDWVWGDLLLQLFRQAEEVLPCYSLGTRVREGNENRIPESLPSISGLGLGGSPAVRFNGEATKRDRATQKLSHSSDKIPTRVAKLNFHDNI